MPSGNEEVTVTIGRSFRALIAMLFLSTPHALAQAGAGHDHDLGAVRFGVSCAAEVQPEFDRGVALLHHMMYEDARRTFEAVAAEDPDCAMARWGIATTLFQPLWPTRPTPEELNRGWTEIEEARALGTDSDRERNLVAATEAFFREPEAAEWRTRIERWAAAMEEAHGADPDDVETGAFYALSQLALGTVSEDRMAHNEEAAEVLLAIHEREPTHPGAIHYTIHANDVDARAGESLDIVRSYSGIAPSVPHALHMPTHIFVRLGEWPAVIEWNRRSANAALEVETGGGVSHHYPHATDYLLYAHLQRGDDESARAVLEETLEKEPYQDTFTSAFHLAAMPARHAIERRAWEEAASIEPRTPTSLAWDRYPWAEAMAWFGRGLGGARSGDLATAGEAETRMAALRDGARDSGESAFATYIEVDRLILSGWIAHAAGDHETAIERIRSAAELEKTVQKHPVTPGALLPAYEALGDLLLELDRPAEALSAYEASLKTWPGRYNTLLGAARAAAAMPDAVKAKAYYEELLANVGDAETARPGVEEARAYR
jgi:tetratricopeptide (TPR) repeat protein